MNAIAYLTSLYPAPSHTFIRREIAALRDAGLTILPFSIRSTPDAAQSELDRATRAETQAVLGRSPFAYLGSALTDLLSHPRRTFGTLQLALRHRSPGAKALAWSVFHAVEALYLARLLRQSGAKRLHCHFANSGATVGLLAAHFNDIPFSMTLHGVSETDYPAGLLLADKVERADFVACASWFMRAQAMRVASPRDWRKLHVVRCGVDLAALPQPRTGVDYPIRFICVGRLSPEKGHRGLFEAFASVLAVEPAARLVLVGDGPLRDELVALASDLGIAGAVNFLGALPEAATLAAIADEDVLVLPSLMEGLPVVLMEAMALGKAVISSGVAGVPELVRDGVSGLLFPPGQWQALQDAMMKLATDKDLCERLGAAGRQKVGEEFAIDRAVRPLIDLFVEGRN